MTVVLPSTGVSAAHRTGPVPSRFPAGTGIASGEADLWCTYAAVRTLTWLDRRDTVVDPENTARYLSSRRNRDGGYAWSTGMPSDAWATFYCTRALTDLGQEITDAAGTAHWLSSTWSGDAFAMMPGQFPDVWATHFSTRTAIEVCGTSVPSPTRLLAWLDGLQTASGGLSWSPEHAATGAADVRACHYGVAAWRALASVDQVAPPWDVSALVAWLRNQQGAEGGFTFSAEAEVPCLWATYRATAALEALGARPERSPEDWIRSLRTQSGAFVRWPGYDVADVWANFCAVGSLSAIGADLSDIETAVCSRTAEFSVPGGGYTYREPEQAADALSTAATLLSSDPDDSRDPHHPHAALDLKQMQIWLSGCQLPNEGGLMYMPGRGSEIRCTLWAIAAGAVSTDPAAIARIVDWLHQLQNPDGGFGYWEGRGSDLVSTSAAVETLRLLGRPLTSVLDTGKLADFVARCADPAGNGFANVPGGNAGLRAGLQALRIRQTLGHPEPAAVADLLHRHRVRGGGYANEGSRMPDLLSGYEATVAADRHGLPLDVSHLETFLNRVRSGPDAAWTPLAPVSGDPLARALATLLGRRLQGRIAVLPALTLS
jgi:prenyltransferase beta subunit